MDPRVTRALEQLESRIHEPLKVRTLAADLGLSASRFSHLFRAEVGASPMRYLHVLRMNRALELLERTSLTVREVMGLVGYNDPSHFARDFRRHHGVSPRARRTLAR
jgi:AraC family transcriptional regulator of arabinose operon